MNVCSINYDSRSQFNSLRNTIDTAVNDLKNRSKNKQKNLNDFINSLKPFFSNGKSNIANNILKKDIQNILENNSEYTDVIISKTELKSIDDIMQALQEYITPGVTTKDKSKSDEALDIESEKSEQEQAEENERPTYIPYRKAVQSVFIGQYSAQQFLIHQFDENVFQRAFLDTSTGKYILNNDELNNSIIRYKNILYNKIVDFLNHGDEIYTKDLYSLNGNLNAQEYTVLQDMWGYIQKRMEEGELSEIITRNYTNVLNDKDAGELDVINAYFQLKYFDDMLYESYGKTISVRSGFRNIESSIVKKYSFKRDDTHERKDWNENESKSAVDNTAKFSKIVLQHVPLKKIIDGNVVSSRTEFVGATKFITAITNIFSRLSKIENNLSAGQFKNIKEYFNNFDASPTYYTYKLFEEISTNNNVQKILLQSGILDDDINAIYSVYDFIYKNNKDIQKISEQTKKSVSEIELINLIKNYKYGKYSIVSDIAGLVNNVSRLEYSETISDTNGSTSVSIRKPYNKRKTSMLYVDNVNSSTFQYGVSILDQKLKNVLISNNYKNFSFEKSYGNIKFNIESQYHILMQKDNTKVKDISIDVNGENFKFKNQEELIKFIYNTVQKYNSKELLNSDNADAQAVRAIMKLSDEFIQTDFANEDGIQKFIYYINLCGAEKNKNSQISDLLLYSAKSAVIMKTYKEMKSDENLSMENYKKFLINRFSFISDKQTQKTYLIENNGIAYFAIIPSNSKWADTLDEADLISKGKTYSSVSKNIEGNNDANTSTQYLGAKLHYISYKSNEAQKRVQEENEKIKETNELINDEDQKEQLKPDTTTSSLIFVNNPNLVERCVINSGAQTRHGTKKLVKNFTEQEIYYNAIVNNFLYKLCDETNSNLVFLQPTTYSDKTKIINYEVNISKFINMSIDELITEYCNSVGKAAQNQEKNIIYKYNQLFNKKFQTLADVDTYLRQKKYSEQELTDLAQSKNIRLKLDLDYRNTKIGGKSYVVANEIVSYKAKEVNPLIAKTRFAEAKREFVKTLLESGINFYIDYSETGQFKPQTLNSDLSKLITESSHPMLQVIRHFYKTSKEQNEYEANWIENRKLKIINENGELNPLLEKYFYISSILENNLRLELTGFETNHPDKSKYKSVWNAVISNFNFDQNNRIISDDILSNIKNINKLEKAQLIFSTNNEYFSDNTINLNKNNTLTLDEVKTAVNSGKKVIVSKETKLTEEMLNYLSTLNSIDLFNEQNDNSHLKVYDLFANNNLIQLSELSTDEPGSIFVQARLIAEKMIDIITNVSQGTQLKRNVIIPATSYLMHSKEFRGIGAKTKVAFIRDIPATVFNFTGKMDVEDSMDGSAFTTIEQSILENGGLQSQEVGLDKKTIWHHFDNETGTSGLMKFAAYAITNQRMKASMNSTVSLYNMYKKMTNLQWNTKDDKGNELWNLCKTYRVNPKTRSKFTPNFSKDILNNERLMYSTYDENGKQIIKQITDFGRDDNGNYYTIEYKVNKLSKQINSNAVEEKIYHFYDDAGNHYTNSTGEHADNLHTINSNFELWLAMGGYNSVEISDGNFVDSESSHLAVVEFMNKIVTLPKNDNTTDRYIVSQETYVQPLKNNFIGYLCNNSAMKQGVENINSTERWFNTDKLNWTELDSDGLGVQMDADHDVDIDAVMKEFSQVVTALTAGGYYHENVRQIYKVLQVISDKSSSLEKSAIDNLMKDISSDDSQARSDAYDMIVRILIDALDSRNNNNGLTDDIVNNIKKVFDKNLNHKNDKIKLPISDQNIYSRLLPALANIINQKSIKRPFPGSGCVMVPGYNTMQYFQIGTKQYMFPDLVELALKYYKDNKLQLPSVQDTSYFERTIVNNYLYNKQNEIPLSSNTDEFIPTDIVNITDKEGDTITTVDLDDINKYYRFKKINEILSGQGAFNYDSSYEVLNNEQLELLNELGFNKDIFDALKEAYLDGGLFFQKNIVNPKNLAPAKITFTAIYGNEYKKMNIFDIPAIRNNILNHTEENEKKARQAFRDLKKNFFISDDEAKIYIQDLQSDAAECIAPDMYGNKFGIQNKSVAKIFQEGFKAFQIKYESPKESDDYDFCFNSNGGQDVYISFTNEKGKSVYQPYGKNACTKYEDGKYKVYLINDKNIKLFQVGEYVLQNGYYVNSENKIVDSNGKVVDKGKFKLLDGKVYQYVEFISKYTVYENTKDQNGNFRGFEQFDKYYISQKNIELCYGKKTKEFYNVISNLLDQIYQTQQFIGIKFNQKIYGNGIDRSYYITSYVNNMKSIDYQFRNTVLNPLVESLEEHRKQFNEKINQIAQESKKTKSDIIKNLTPEQIAVLEQHNSQINNNIKIWTKDYYTKVSKERFSSWQQSLYYTVARIPAQNLQSFMQMRVVAYTGGTKNVVHVSHWQTWLQGSDYDIDKAYMMGQEFGQNGKLVAFSNLFDYSTLSTLKASLRLPIPQNYEIKISNEFQNNDIVNKYINNIYNNNKAIYGLNQKLNEENKLVNKNEDKIRSIVRDRNRIFAQRLNNLAQLITILYNQADRSQSKEIILEQNDQFKDTIDWIVKQIQIHQQTKISPFQENAAYRNMVSAGIQNTVQDLTNMADAYEPISMSDLKLNNGKITDAMVLNQLNPLMKYVMQSQNMVGKKVIGIMAVGEKVNYNLNFYFNEKLRLGDTKYVDFEKTYSRIQGRYNFSKSHDLNDISSVTKRMISDINFSDVSSNIKEHFVIVDNVLTEFKTQNGRKYDPHSEEDQKIYNELLNKECQKNGVGVNNKVDGMISELLSAATDNAKELILYQINCDTNMAKCYIHLLIMGFNIKDVVSYMTSPAVNLISKISKTNMWDSFINNLYEQDVINIADGIIPIEKFIMGTSSDYDGNIIVNYETFASKLKINDNFIKATGIAKKDFQSFGAKERVQAYIEAKVQGKLKKTLSEYIDPKKTDQKILCDYIEQIASNIREAIMQYDGETIEEKFKQYKQDVKQYKQVVEGGNEMSNLGNVLLGMNQGLPSSKEDLTTKIRMIKKIITDREKALGIFAYKLKNDKEIDDITNVVSANNKYLDKYRVKQIFLAAKAYGIIGGMDFDKWIYDIKLNKEQYIVQDKEGKNKSIIKSLPKDIAQMSYRQLVKEYYDILKYSINVFDVIDIVPQFKSIIDLLQKVYTFDKQFSLRSNIIDKVTNKVLEYQSYIDDKMVKQINNYARDLMIASFFNDVGNTYSFPVKQGMEGLSKSYKNIKFTRDQNIDLNTPIGRASFKKVFMDFIINLQNDPTYKDYISKDAHIENNYFINHIKINTDKYNIPYLVTSLDLNERNSNINNEQEFQKLIDGLEELKKIKISELSLYDWFAVYNLFVNQNQYGRERLTTFFKNYDIGIKSKVLTDFFKYESELDYNYKTDELLNSIGFDINDVLIRLAPFTSEYNESQHTESYIKEKDSNGITIIKKKIGKQYKKISIFPKDSLLSDYDDTPSFEQNYNYNIYQSIKLSNQDIKINTAREIASKDPATLADALYRLINSSAIRITTIHC